MVALNSYFVRKA